MSVVTFQATDHLFLQHIKFLRAVAENDPKLKTLPEFQAMLNEIENDSWLNNFPHSTAMSLLMQRDRRSDFLKELAFSLREQYMKNQQNSVMEAKSNNENADS